MNEWTLPGVLDAIADVAPDRLMTVCADRRSTFGESALRTRRLANFLAHEGFGVHRPRAELNRWECGQDRVALVMYNDLYPDMLIGCPKGASYPGECEPPLACHGSLSPRSRMRPACGPHAWRSSAARRSFCTTIGPSLIRGRCGKRRSAKRWA